MKKLWSILTAFVLMLGCCVFASATTPHTTVEVETSDLFIEVTVKTTKAADRLTLKVINTQNNAALYAAQKTTPTYVADGVMTYEFSFYAKDGSNSGSYRAVVGGFGETVSSETFSMITNADKRDFYNTLDGKAADDIQLFFSTHELFLPQPYADYVQIDPELLTLINSEIEGMNLAVEEDYSNLAEVDTAFCDFYAKSVLLANVIQEEDISQWDGYIKELIDGFDFYAEYYNKLEPADVYTYFTVEKTKTIDLDVINTAFDESTILAITKKFNATILRDAIAVYRERDTVTMDLSDYSTLDEDEKLAVCEAVKTANPANFVDFCEALASNAEKTANEDPAGDGSPIGGGSSIGGGGSSVGGGGSAGGGGSVSVNGNREETGTKPAPVEPVKFTDIAHVGWANEAISYLAEEGVLNGKSAGNFCPDDNITREEFVKIISEAFGYTTDKASAEFSDVSKDKWSYRYIASAYAAGIITGTGDGYFGAHDKITRQDMAVILSRVLALADIKATGGESFADAKDVAPYAKDAIDTLSSLGIVNGMGDGTFAPKANVTRAQAAKAIYETLMIVIK